MRDDGGAAFPISLDQMRDEAKGHGAMTGMTLRDYFAGQVLASHGGFADDGPLSWITRLFYGRDVTNEKIAEDCYELADAMIAERNRTQR